MEILRETPAQAQWPTVNGEELIRRDMELYAKASEENRILGSALLTVIAQEQG